MTSSTAMVESGGDAALGEPAPASMQARSERQIARLTARPIIAAQTSASTTKRRAEARCAIRRWVLGSPAVDRSTVSDLNDVFVPKGNRLQTQAPCLTERLASVTGASRLGRPGITSPGA